MRWLCDTPVKTWGRATTRSGRRHSGCHMTAPSASPASTSAVMRSSCSAELIAPMSVFLSSGSPRRSVLSRRANVNPATLPGTTLTRVAAQATV